MGRPRLSPGQFFVIAQAPAIRRRRKGSLDDLNTIQENITKGGQRDYSRRRPNGDRMPKSRAIKGIDEDLRLNKALWHMAEVLRTGGLQA